MPAAKQAFAQILDLHEHDLSAKLILQRIADYEALKDKSTWSPVNALSVK